MRHTANTQLITDHVDMARRIAHSIARRVPFDRRDDLESAALLGLTEAAQRFNPDRGEPFGAFAVQRIRGAVLDELRRGDILSRQARSMARKVRRAITLCETRHGHSPASADLATELGIDIDDVERFRGDEGRSVSIDAADAAVLAHESDPAERLDLQRRSAMLSAAMCKLSQRERDVMNMYYEGGMKMKDIGAELGVTESRVSQLCSSALRSLKHAVRGEVAPAAPRCRPRVKRSSSRLASHQAA